VHRFRKTRVYMGMTSTATPPTSTGTQADWAELRSRLHAFVARRIRDDAAGEDLVQEILIRLHRGLPRLRDNERLDAFAYQIARNAIADHYRRSRPDRPLTPEQLADHEAIAEEDDDDAGKGRAQLALCLRPLVERLDDDYRDALLLTDLGELSQAEAARSLGLSAPGMRSRVQRGRAQVREALAECCSVELDAASQIDRVERVGRCACG
jgi:RNA polymerase sigma-70 factor (ECF subfamily)